MEGLRMTTGGAASPPYTRGPYVWDQQVTFSAGLSGVNAPGKIMYVDGDNGSDSNDGRGWVTAYKTIQAAVTAAGRGGTVFVAPLATAAGASDPSNYTESVIIPATHDGLSITGVGTGRVQGGLPQLKIGATTTNPLITIRAPSCLIANMGINGAGATGGGILLDDDSGLPAASGGETKSAFGTSICGCHFKNCVGTTSTAASTGGAIMWAAGGGGFQVLIKGNRFYKNTGDIVVKGTGYSVPQDVVIEDNIFGGPSASVHMNILVGGSGVNGLIIRNNTFQQIPSLGTAPRFINLATGTVGMIVGCTFGCQTSHTGGTKITFASAGTGGIIPATVHIAQCYGQSIKENESGEVVYI